MWSTLIILLRIHSRSQSFGTKALLLLLLGWNLEPNSFRGLGVIEDVMDN
jgi:hypothetical protein